MAKQTTATATIEQTTPVVLDSVTDLEYLMQQKRSINEAIKQAKANRKGNDQERLAKEVETQELAPNKSLTYDCWAYVSRRIQVGQDPATAKAEFLNICARLVDEGLQQGCPKPKKATTTN